MLRSNVFFPGTTRIELLENFKPEIHFPKVHLKHGEQTGKTKELLVALNKLSNSCYCILLNDLSFFYNTKQLLFHALLSICVVRCVVLMILD